MRVCSITPAPLTLDQVNGFLLYVSGKLPTYPFPKATFCPKCEVSVNVGVGEGRVGSFPETYNDHNFHEYAKRKKRKSMTVSEEISMATDPKAIQSIRSPTAERIKN